MSLELRPATPDDVDALVALAVRAFEPGHESMAEVLGSALNMRVYPDWAASQEADVRAACADPDLDTVVARALTSRALDHLKQAGCTLVHVATGGDAGHAPARALCSAAGFTPLPLVRYYREL